MIVFRIIHIVSAILWAGAAVYFAGFVGPTFAAFRPESGKYFSYLVGRRKAVIFFLTVSTLTVVAGGFLYWRDSGGLDSDWILTGFGTGLTVGGIAGLIAWLMVLLVLAPTSYRTWDLDRGSPRRGRHRPKNKLRRLERCRQRSGVTRSSCRAC